eukprot:scaffold184_cov316-Pinguiococcus_pyrenoidosus.AAC.66
MKRVNRSLPDRIESRGRPCDVLLVAGAWLPSAVHLPGHAPHPLHEHPPTMRVPMRKKVQEMASCVRGPAGTGVEESRLAFSPACAAACRGTSSQWRRKPRVEGNLEEEKIAHDTHVVRDWTRGAAMMHPGEERGLFP